MRTNDAAARANVSRRYIRQAIARGQLRASKDGRDWQIAETDFDEWNSNRKSAGRPKMSDYRNPAPKKEILSRLTILSQFLASPEDRQELVDLMYAVVEYVAHTGENAFQAGDFEQAIPMTSMTKEEAREWARLIPGSHYGEFSLEQECALFLWGPPHIDLAGRRIARGDPRKVLWMAPEEDKKIGRQAARIIEAWTKEA